MNLKAIVYIIFLGFGYLTYAQNYVIYDVKPNDTPRSIAQANSIYFNNYIKYNPDLKNTIYRTTKNSNSKIG